MMLDCPAQVQPFALRETKTVADIGHDTCRLVIGERCVLHPSDLV